MMQRNGGKLGKGGNIVFSIIGVVFAIIGCFLFVKNINNKKTQTAETIAIVQEYDVVEDYDYENGNSITYYPIFKYSVDSIEYIEKYSTGTSNKKYEEGSEVTLYYDPSNPKSYRVKGDNTMDWLPPVFIGLGALLAVVGIVGYKRFDKYENAPVHENIPNSVTKVDEINNQEEVKEDESLVNNDHHVDTPDIK